MTGGTWPGGFDIIAAGTNIDVDEGLDALRTICAHALDLADALDLAAMCGLTEGPA